MNRKLLKEVLLIEDNPGDVKLLREMLREQSATTVITHVERMSEAEAYLATRTPDMILVDLGLPDAHGMEAVRRAHALAPSVPLVVLTGLDDDSLAVQSLKGGAQDYLVKGQLETRGLLRALNYAAERKIMEDALRAEMKRAQGTLDALQIEVGKRIQAESNTRESEHQLAQAQKMEAIGQLTGGIAHDFNNLLTVIKGNAEDLYEDLTATPALRHQVAMVLQAAGRGADLVRHLLTFARKQDLRPEIIEMKTILDPLARMLRRTLQENVAIEIRASADLHTINVDSGSLENAILNLAINARDAMPDGGRLTIEAENTVLDAEYAATNPTIQPGPYVLIAISDTGTGMSKAVIDRAFEPFFTTKEVGKGTGLGLSMVFGFIKQSGGHAKIYSEVGHGTTIKIYLPASAQSASVQVAALPEKVAPPSTARMANILLVEDDELVRESVTHKLRRFGYTVTSAPAPAEAIVFLETMPAFDLVFTDVIMPGEMNGADLAREVQRRWPTTKILVTSGYTETTLLGKIKLPDGVSLLSKPYSNADFALALQHVLAA